MEYSKLLLHQKVQFCQIILSRISLNFLHIIVALKLQKELILIKFES